MNNNDMWLDAYDELKPELSSLMIPTNKNTSLDDYLKKTGPMPPEALFLGVASDGLPVLLNLYDSIPGPILIVGDAGVGKTKFLQVMVSAATKQHKKEDVEFGVITRFIDEWSGFYSSPNCVGIFPSYHSASADFILSLASWAHGNKTSRQAIVLFIDGLENIQEMDFDARQNLRWLLLRGPARHVWPIITINTNQIKNTEAWTDAFHTRIFGRIKNTKQISFLDEKYQDMPNLFDDKFVIKEGNSWISFYLPEL